MIDRAAVVQTGDPTLLDKGGAWLLDRIALERCHYYFCAGGGQFPARATYTFELAGRPLTVTHDVLECAYHARR